MIAFTSAVESLRLANRAAGRELYAWRLASADGAPMTASCGLQMAVGGALATAGEGHTVVLCGGIDSQHFSDKGLFSWLRRMDRQGADLGALCTGSHVLARAGLLDGYCCTIHWENLAAFAEDFPDIEVTSELFEIDSNRFTCSGGTAALDLMLNRIALTHGDDLATKVSEQCIVDRIRGPHDRQRMPLRVRLGVHHPKLIRAVEIMESRIEETLSQEVLAQHVGLSLPGLGQHIVVVSAKRCLRVSDEVQSAQRAASYRTPTSCCSGWRFVPHTRSCVGWSSARLPWWHAAALAVTRSAQRSDRRCPGSARPSVIRRWRRCR
jgi:transcriptional regulator GlxA family with amidase domain